MQLSKDDFGADFTWGVSAAAYQIEGAHQTGGKGASVWDTFSNTKGKIKSGETGNVACDFYHKYAHDLLLMHQLHIPNFRFSISWSRVLPNGTGFVNRSGIEFYNRLIDFCLELDIEPWITLYHWDLPYELEKKGGWANREIIDWFNEYVQLCISRFGDRVKNWMVLNEPMVFTGAGYFLGIHAPGKRNLRSFFAAAHHAALCQAEGGRLIRSLKSDCKIGTTFSCSHVEPLTQDADDISAAVRMDTLMNRMFIEPLLGLSYPVKDLPLLERMGEFILPGDEQKLAFDMDFIGIQNYTREIIRYSRLVPLINAKIVSAGRRNVETTAMDWEVYPESIYHLLKKFGAYPGKTQLIVTENGAAFPDILSDGVVADEKRIKYLQSYLKQVLRAKQEGVNVNGYFVWTFLDNFEWAEGYRPRFGLVHVDFSTQKRTIKNSGRWYKNFLDAATY